jgi:hypothetical protein
MLEPGFSQRRLADAALRNGMPIAVPNLFSIWSTA